MSRITCDNDLRQAVTHLVAVEPRFAVIIERHGLPPLRLVQPGLQSLLRIVTDQLISLKAGEAIWKRLAARLQSFEPQDVLACKEDELRSLGLSSAKARTFHAAASAFAAGGYEYPALAKLAPEDAHRMLTEIRGIGPWTADIYILAALQSADAWPAGDLALQAAAKHLLGLQTRPTQRQTQALAEPWRPFRAAAARLLWSHYRGLKGLDQTVI
jgi:DNA-3-methyladenine glycosylase II